MKLLIAICWFVLFITSDAQASGKPGVYAIECVPGYVKVGRAHDIEQRMRELQTACPFDLKLLAVLSTNPDDEGLWHRKFHSCHYRGEWFRECPLVMEAIQKANRP